MTTATEFATKGALKAGLRRLAFAPVFVCSLFLVQTIYGFAYVHVPLLRTTSLLPNAIRLGTWTVPVVVYLARSRSNVLECLRLRRNALRGIAWGLVIGSLLVVLNLAGMHLLKGHARLNPYFSALLWWKAVILVGFSEEVVFRGFFLPEFAEKTSFWIANLAQAVMFLTIHVPGWILLGNSLQEICRNGAYILFVGAALGFVWKKSNSLWACILIHSFNNFCSFAIQ